MSSEWCFWSARAEGSVRRELLVPEGPALSTFPPPSGTGEDPTQTCAPGPLSLSVPAPATWAGQRRATLPDHCTVEPLLQQLLGDSVSPGCFSQEARTTQHIAGAHSGHMLFSGCQLPSEFPNNTLHLLGEKSPPLVCSLGGGTRSFAPSL